MPLALEGFRPSAGSLCMATSPVTVYWRPGCVFCMQLRSRLRRAHVTVAEVNIWEDKAAAAIVRSIAGGNETVPTVAVGDVTMVNPSFRRVMAEIQARSPELIGSLDVSANERREGRDRIRGIQWALITLLVTASIVADATGHGALSWAIDGVAITVFLTARSLRRSRDDRRETSDVRQAAPDEGKETGARRVPRP